jgi:hypothetical protein
MTKFNLSLNKKSHKIMGIVVLMLLVFTFIPHVSASYYKVEIEMYNLVLCNDGDSYGNGEVYWEDLFGTEYLGSLGGEWYFNGNWFCTIYEESETLTRSVSSPSTTSHFEMYDDDGWRTQDLWKGDVITTTTTGGWVSGASEADSSGSNDIGYGITISHDYARSYSGNYNVVWFRVKVSYISSGGPF